MIPAAAKLGTGAGIAAAAAAHALLVTQGITVDGGKLIEILLVTLIGIVVAGGSFLGKLLIGTNRDVAVLKSGGQAVTEVRQKVDAAASDIIELEGETARLNADVAGIKVKVDTIGEEAARALQAIGDKENGGLATEVQRLRDWRHDEVNQHLTAHNLEIPMLRSDVDRLDGRVGDLERGN